MAIEIIVGGVIQVLTNLVIPAVAPKVDFSWSLKDELKRLQHNLETIHAKIADAEENKENNNELRLWLKRLKDVAYDADDAIDEFNYETMRPTERESLKHKALDFVSSSNPLAYRRKLKKKIKKINKRVDEIAEDMQKFHLQTMDNNTTTSHGESSEQRSRQTASSINESDIIGREDEKERIITMLTKVIPSSSSTSSGSNLEKVSVVSIVGMGGLGKTSLAQLVFKDEMVNKHFDLTMWVHVSQDFDVEKLFTKIMESSTQNKFEAPSNFAVLANKVQEQLNGKKYLLVLDDLWNQEADQWEAIFNPLLVGAQGSKILITTRNMKVADVVKGSIPPYQLEELQDDECWSIIKKIAFSPGGAVKTPNMTNIGRRISKKCDGLPLAAKVLGGLMRLRNKEVDWLSLEKDVSNAREGQSEIIPILKLSYDNFSSELKQCFSYTSIFPKNSEIDRKTLVQLWIAEGFLGTCKVRNGRAIEDAADEYFENLVRSSFLDGVKKTLLEDIVTCKMHDLVHDLARAVAGDQELASLKVSEFNNTTEIRRLELNVDEDLSSTFLNSLRKEKKLRTLFISEGSNLVDPFMLSENSHLRVLHVGDSQNHPLTRPKWRSLGLLKHLRYLRFTRLDLREVENDQSINKLYNLETLVLNLMSGVQIQNLLSDIQSLQKLRYLQLSWTDMVELPNSVTSLGNLQSLDLNHSELKVIPDSISGLKNLRFLNLSFNPIEELPASVVTLSNLETLDVNSCKKLKSLPESVAGLAKLRIFNFQDCSLLEALPEDLGELTQIRSLDISGTAITVLPDSYVNLHNLEFARLLNCEHPVEVKNFTKLRRFLYRQLEPLSRIGKLPLLEGLTYSVPEKYNNLPALGLKDEGTVGIQELGNLNFLETLFITDLQNVKDPIDAERANINGKQNLRRLYLNWQLNLSDLLSDGLTLSDLLDLSSDRELKHILLQRYLNGDEGTRRWDQNSCNFQVFEALQPPTGLSRLTIQNFMGRDFPTWMMCIPSALPNLVQLELINCSGMKQLSASDAQLPRVRNLQLERMYSLKSLDIGGFPSLTVLYLTDMFLLEELMSSPLNPCLRELRIEGCGSLTDIPLFPSLMELVLKKVNHKLVSSAGRSQTSTLTRIWLENIEDLIYFPAGVLQNNSNLQTLNIRECNQFEGFQNLNDNHNNQYCFLQFLGLIDCPVLKFLPDLRGWTSLQRLLIFNCPQVKESLTYDLKSLSFLKALGVDFIQRDDKRGDPSTYNDLINLMEK